MIVVGTSGWQYRDWRGRLYPSGTPQRRWLAVYAERFRTVEINSAFYRLPDRSTFSKWAAEVPDGFCFAVKVSRYLTHVRRLADPAEPVARFVDRARGLAGKLGPVLLQLPPTLRADADLLDRTLQEFPREVRVAVEPRHESWWTTDIRRVLEKRGATLAWADRLGRPVTPLWRTADFGYVRLHEGRARPRPRYGRRALASWVERIAGAYPDEEVFVFFNNDPGGAAVADAEVLERIGASRGLVSAPGRAARPGRAR